MSLFAGTGSRSAHTPIVLVFAGTGGLPLHAAFMYVLAGAGSLSANIYIASVFQLLEAFLYKQLLYQCAICLVAGILSLLVCNSVSATADCAL